MEAGRLLSKGLEEDESEHPTPGFADLSGRGDRLATSRQLLLLWCALLLATAGTLLAFNLNIPLVVRGPVVSVDPLDLPDLGLENSLTLLMPTHFGPADLRVGDELSVKAARLPPVEVRVVRQISPDQILPQVLENLTSDPYSNGKVETWAVAQGDYPSGLTGLEFERMQVSIRGHSLLDFLFNRAR